MSNRLDRHLLVFSREFQNIYSASLNPVPNRIGYILIKSPATSRLLLFYYFRKCYESFLRRQMRLDRSDQADLPADITTQIHL